jgi:hypothetical protein
MHDGGKGDIKKKLTVPEEQFNASWDLIFNKNPVKTYTGNRPNYVIPIDELSSHEKECGK